MNVLMSVCRAKHAMKRGRDRRGSVRVNKKKSEWPEALILGGVIWVCIALIWGTCAIAWVFLKEGYGYMSSLLVGVAIMFIGIACRAIREELRRD